MEEGLLFGGHSPPNKKSISLRPLRLCVENPILDKSEPANKTNEMSPFFFSLFR